MKDEYLGRWRIIDMEEWSQDYIDMVVPGYILFEADDSGEFQFGLVRGYMNCRIKPYGDSERVEFTWDGEDEMDPASGRGWAMINEDGQLEGILYFHNGDDSGFTAEKSTGTK
jgi:hypothetical protein